MSERIITLFGEEIIPEQVKAVGKSRAKKKPEEKQQELQIDLPAATDTPVADAAIEENTAAAIEEQEETAITESSAVVPEKEIIIPEDWDGDKQYYTIGEVAALFKVKTSHIRFWTNEFKLKVRTTRKGDRLFTPDQIRELRAIHHLVKERGFTLTGAKAKLKAQNKMDVETIDLKQSLLQLRNKLLIIRNQLVS